MHGGARRGMDGLGRIGLDGRGWARPGLAGEARHDRAR